MHAKKMINAYIPYLYSIRVRTLCTYRLPAYDESVQGASAEIILVRPATTARLACSLAAVGSKVTWSRWMPIVPSEKVSKSRKPGCDITQKETVNDTQTDQTVLSHLF